MYRIGLLTLGRVDRSELHYQNARHGIYALADPEEGTIGAMALPLPKNEQK